MSLYSRIFSTQKTPQSEPIPGSTQVANSAGGFAFAVDDWVRLDRFLVLGAEGGSYYASERKLTIENAHAVQRCLEEDGLRAVARIVAVSEAGRAPKNAPAIFALALAAACKTSTATRQAALAALPRVCRTGTHLFEFAAAVQNFRGHGRALNRAFQQWYLAMKPRDLAYQVTKYQQRGGWSHRDLLRLAKPRGSGLYQDIFHWVTKGWPDVGDQPHPEAALLPIWAMERAQRAATAGEVARLIRDYDLVRECIPSQWLNSPEVWEALLVKMPLTALVRNLATMTRVGLLTPLAAAVQTVTERLGDLDHLRRARLHPVGILAALLTYRAGRGERGKHTWAPIPQVVDALDAAFYLSFGTVETTGKRWMLALDVSGSMSCGTVAGVPGLTPRVASAAMALVTAAVEPQHVFTAFSNQMVPVSISPRQRLDDVCRQLESIPMGGTDCALPMLHAEKLQLPIDTFVVLTDSETWAGDIHPLQALRKYRQRMGIAAKLIVAGMVSNGFTIADPNDAGMLDVVGFDTATPQLMADFASES